MFHVSIEYLPIDEEDRNLVDDRLYNERMQAEVRQSVPARPMKINAGWLPLLGTRPSLSALIYYQHSTVSSYYGED